METGMGLSMQKSGKGSTDLVTPGIPAKSLKVPQDKLQEAREALAETFKEAGSAERIAFSFNGGKDSIAALHISKAVFKETFGQDAVFHIVVWNVKNDFPEVKEAINHYVFNHKKELKISSFPNWKDLQKDVHTLKDSGVEYIILGTRQADLKPTEEAGFTMPMWGGGTRILPILKFTTVDIMAYLKHYDLSYPSVYDQGYSSLGALDETIRNPFLFDEASGQYLPAWNLPHDRLERCGRAYVNKEFSEPRLGLQRPSSLPKHTVEAALSDIYAKGLASAVEIEDFSQTTKELRKQYSHLWVLEDPNDFGLEKEKSSL